MMASMVDRVCQKLGIGPRHKVISTKGRTGTVVGVEYSTTDNGKLWVLVDGDPKKHIQVPQSKFKKPDESKTTPG